MENTPDVESCADHDGPEAEPKPAWARPTLTYFKAGDAAGSPGASFDGEPSFS